MTISSDPAEVQSTIESLETERHPPGVANWLLQLIEQLPVPYPVFCLGVFIAGTALQQLILVLNFKTPFLPLDIDSLLNGYVMAYCLALILYVKRSARQSLLAFAPVLDLDKARYQHLHSALINLPTGPAFLCGLFLVLASVLVNYVFAGEEIRAKLVTPAVMGTAVGSACLTYSLVGILVYDLIRKLWLISRIYSYARKLDLFNHRSLYAFSGLTARILAGWILLSYPNVLLADLWRSPAWLSITGLMLFLVVAAFAYTLLHIHSRIKMEKDSMLFAVQNRLQSIFTQLHERMDSGALHDVNQLKALIDSLLVERDTITKISTWPWESGTLTSFFSVVLLPIGIWLFQTWVKKLLGS